ncbi:MAG: hypothetical protein IPL86_19145 [Flavobacteriales bacterium]|nr:hypothetical protein [Flavobacteriales bacterium]
MTNAAKLPDNFRAKTQPLRFCADDHVNGLTWEDYEQRCSIITKVCNRGQQLSDDGRLTGATPEAIQQQLYGSVFVWGWLLWQYGGLIWNVIKLLAALAHANRQQSSESRLICK